MIASLRGQLLVSTPLVAVVEAGGVGYEVHVPLSTSGRLPAPGQAVFLHTHAVYREDAQTLYGFATAEERDFFRLMVEKVAGVGPKVALSALSKLPLPALQAAIAQGDVDLLAKCPGIGRKTAERIVLDLKGAIAHLLPGPGGTAGAVAAPGGAGWVGLPAELADAAAALVALGYKPPEAEKAVRRAQAALGNAATTEALIKRALS
jgi:Holliday junction DNA helicase RuvA